jgi:molecular chaperone DnaK
LTELKKSLEGNETASIKSATEKVAEVSQSLGAALYAAGAAAGASAEGAAASSTNEDGVEDAEIVEEK